MTATAALPFADLALSRRLERAEARANAEFVEARAQLFPESGAAWIEVAGAYAMFDGVASPVTQTFGLGLFEQVSSADLDALETFFERRGAPVFHEISPLADPALLPLLIERRYHPVEFSSVMYRSIERDVRSSATRNPDIHVRRIQTGEEAAWARTAAEGWSEFTELAGMIFEMAHVGAMRQSAMSFVAEIDGQAIATGSLGLCAGVALLAGASTIPEGRRRGAQLALLESRLRHAAENGCDLAMMCTLPGSASQRNAERQGFRIAYTRIKWKLVR